MALLLIVGGFAWSQARSHQGVDDLLDLVEASETRLGNYIDERTREVDDLVKRNPATGTSVALADTERTLGRINDNGTAVLANSIVAQHDLQSLRFVDGSDLDEARDAYVAHIDEWAVHIESFAEFKPGVAVTTDIDYNTAKIMATWTIAEREITQLDLTAAQRERVEILFPK